MTATITRKLVSLTDAADILAVSTKTADQARFDREVHRRPTGWRVAPGWVSVPSVPRMARWLFLVCS